MELFNPKPKFQSFQLDKTAYLDLLMDNGLIESGLVKKSGLNPYQIAQRPIFEAYAQKKLWSMIAKEYLINSHEDDYDLRLSQGLVSVGNFRQLQQLWRTYLVNARSWYWNKKEELARIVSEPETEHDGIQWAEVKSTSIAAFTTYRAYVREFPNTRELDWIDEEIELLENEEKRKPRLKKPLPDKIEDTKFWSIIQRARSESGDAVEQFNEHIVDQLQDFKAAEIKRFQNTLDDKLEALNHWSLWALAHISQGGCSDDGFLYFRSWLISRGEEAYDQAVTDVRSLLPQVSIDGIAENEGLLFAAFEAYDIRSGGKELVLRERKEKPPYGEEWDETDVHNKYPEISNYYRQS